MAKGKKILSLGLIIALFLLAYSISEPVSASTVDAEAAAQELYDLGLFSGTGRSADGSVAFELDRAPTRNEAVTMLVRLLGKEAEAKSSTYNTPFTDVPEWAESYVGYAYNNGLAYGVGQNEFGGSSPVSATQYITFALRALGYSSSTDFSWDRAWELSDKLGVTNGQYNANTPFTRGDVAIISRNALSAHIKGSTTTLQEANISGNQPAQGVAVPPVATDSKFEVHFIDVGQADAILVLCDDASMLIDGGNADDSSLIYSYLKKQSIDYLDYIICTHAHEDQVGGLAGALNYAKVGTAYCSVTSYDTRAFQSFVKYLGNQGKQIEVPQAGDTFSLGSATVKVLGPINNNADPNNMSIVLRVVYGQTSFLFSGDAEREEEQDILNAGYALQSTVLKVGHHGSDSSTSYPFLREVMPTYSVISVGEENPYGHPTENTLSRLRDADVKVYRTDMQGDIICKSDGKNVQFTVSRNADANTLGNVGSRETTYQDNQNTSTGLDETIGSADTQKTSASSYILNKNSHVFHYPYCSSVGKMSEKNKVYFEGTRDEAIAQGYKPCGVCHP